MSSKRPAGPAEFPAGIGRPATRALTAAGYTRLDQLSRARPADLLKLHGFGPKALRLLTAALASRGKSFAPDRKV
jgi:hypothetical protein